MKKLYYLTVLALILGLVLTGCTLLSNISQVPTSPQSGITYSTKGDVYTLSEYTLYAGQNIPVGTVNVWNDFEKLYVQYVVDDPWEMTGSHLYVGKTDPANFPSTPGQFPYSPGMEKSPSPNASYYDVTMTYTIYLNEIDDYEFVGKGQGKGLNAMGTPGVVPGDEIYIAAHADVQKLSEVMATTLVTGEGTDNVLHITENEFNPGYPVGYSGPYYGTPSPAVLAWGPSSWPSILGAQWISSAYLVEDPDDNSWRLFTRRFDIPLDAINLSGTLLQITSDNAEEVYLNGDFVGIDGEVYGPFIDNHEWNTVLPYDISSFLQPGTNFLEVMVRNYKWPGGIYANPTGLIYSMDYQYQLLTTETAWAEGDSQVFGKNWATYFTYDIAGPFPTISSADLAGPYNVGETQQFNVTTVNPEDGFDYSAVLFNYTIFHILKGDIASFEYSDGTNWHNLLMSMSQDGDNVTGYFGPPAPVGFPMSAPYDVTTTFRINITTIGTYTVVVTLDNLVDPCEVLALFTQDVVFE